MHFQELLSKIPNWSKETLDAEFQRIMLYSRCDWISDINHRCIYKSYKSTF